MKRRVMAMAAGALTLAVAVGAGLVMSGSATARGSECSKGKLCFWAGTEGTGKQVNVSGRRGVSNKLANEMNNEASSFINGTEHRVYLYAKRDGKGDLRCYEPFAVEADLEADSGFGDVASSSKVTKGDTCLVDDPPKARLGGPCPDKALCVFEHNDYAGERIVIKREGVSNKLFKRFDETASSAINNRGKASYLYSEKNAEGDWFCIERRSGVGDMGSFNDAASSSRNAGGRNCLR